MAPRGDRPGRAIEGLGAAISTLASVALAPWRFVRWLADWLRWWSARPTRRLMAAVLLTLVVLAAAQTRTTRLDLRYAQARSHTTQVAETFYIPPPDILRLTALGHPAFVSDMLFIRANAYFMSHLFGDRVFAWLDTYANAMIHLDPDNPRVYEWASQATKYGQTITNEALEKSNAYARRGLERFPDNWRFYVDIGFNYFIEWRTESEAERRRMRAKALPYFALAAALPGSELDPNFVAELYAREDDVEMALFHAYLRYWDASEQERASLRGRIARYESQAAGLRLARIEERWKADYAYMPVGLFEMLGPEQGPVLPRQWLARVGDSSLWAESEPVE